MPWYTIKSGDCLSALALRAGLKDANAIYDHADNAELREKRPDPNLLHPGDEVFIPELTAKEEDADTDTRHTFRRVRPPRKCRVRLLDVLGQPYANEPYVFTVGKDTREDGSTDGDGWIEETVPATIRSAKLVIAGNTMVLSLSGVSPITTVRGIQERLNNLGYPCGTPDDKFGPLTSSALASFQRASVLSDNLTVETFGKPEQATLEQLALAHDGVECSAGGDLQGELEYEPDSVPEDTLADPDEDSGVDESEDEEEEWEPDVESDRETVF